MPFCLSLSSLGKARRFLIGIRRNYGGTRGNRTHDLRIKSPQLYLLSYSSRAIVCWLGYGSTIRAYCIVDKRRHSRSCLCLRAMSGTIPSTTFRWLTRMQSITVCTRSSVHKAHTERNHTRLFTGQGETVSVEEVRLELTNPEGNRFTVCRNSPSLPFFHWSGIEDLNLCLRAPNAVLNQTQLMPA